MSIRTFCMALTVGWLAAGAALAQTPSTSEPPTAPAPATPLGVDGASSAYVLGRDDVLEVGLLGRKDFGGRARVQADGTIQLPLVGKVVAADRTTAELSEEVGKALVSGGYFADPVVTIEIVGFASRYVTVLGSIGSPGLIPINRPYRLSEILARVGGARDTAADYMIVTGADGKESRYPIRDLASGDLARDPFVKAGDKIFVPPVETFYIYGQVNSPGGFPLASDTTIRIAIAKAGGLTESGSDKKVDITRGGKKVKVKLDDKVQPGDVLHVGERMF